MIAKVYKKIKNNFEDWIIYYLLILIIAGISSFVVQMIATGLPLYCIDIGKTTAESGIMAGFYTIALIISRSFVGKLTDEKGKWNIAIIGMFLMILSIAGMSFFGKLIFFNIYQLLEGLAFSALSTAIAALLLDILPPSATIKGIALFTVTKSLTISVGASVAVSFAEKFGSERIFIFTLLLSIVAFALLFFLKKTEVKNHSIVKSDINIKNEYKGINKFIYVSALPICLIQFVFTFSLTLGTCYLPAYAQSIGLTGVGIYYTISAITMFASRTVFAKILDRLNTKVSFVIGMLLASSTTIAILFSNKLLYFALLSIPNAIGICMINPMLNVKATGNVPADRRGVASSTYYASLDLGSGAGSMIWGILVPVIGYKFSFVSATILLILIAIYGIYRVIKE